MGYELFMTQEEGISPEVLVDEIIAGKYSHRVSKTGVFRQICFWNSRITPIRLCGFFVDKRVAAFVDEWNKLYKNLQIGYYQTNLKPGYDGLERINKPIGNRVFGVFSIKFPKELINSGVPSRIMLLFRLFGTEEIFLGKLTENGVFKRLAAGKSSLKGVIDAGSIRTVHNLVNPNTVDIPELLDKINNVEFVLEHQEVFLRKTYQTDFWKDINKIVSGNDDSDYYLDRF